MALLIYCVLLNIRYGIFISHAPDAIGAEYFRYCSSFLPYRLCFCNM